MNWPKTCYLCGSDDKNKKKHFINSHMGTAWWGVFADRTCWKCKHYESHSNIVTCRTYGTNGVFDPVTNFIEYATRINDFLNHIKFDLGLGTVDEILTTVQTKQLFHPQATFTDQQVSYCKLYDEYLNLEPKDHYSPVNPTHLSELIHWQTLTLIFDYCEKVGILTGPMDNMVPVNYVDSHCHADRLKINFGVNGTQDVVMALYAEIKDDRYEGCVSNLVDPWMWNGPISSAIINDPRVHITVGLHPKHHNKMCDSIKNDIDRMLTLPTVVGFGEIGLDYHNVTESDKSGQMDSFRQLLKIASKTRRTVIIHGREAFDDILTEMKKELVWSTIVHYHSFEYGIAEANKFLESFPKTCFGLTGKIVKRKDHMKDIINSLPLENLICETDSPYFPIGNHPFSCPSDVLAIMEELAKRKNKSVNEVMIQMRQNIKTLYRF